MTNQNYICEVANNIRQASGVKGNNPDFDDLFNIYAVLALSKGCDITDEDVHEAWSAWASRYHTDSNSIIPFDELSRAVQAKDSKFTKAIKSVACTLPEFNKN